MNLGDQSMLIADKMAFTNPLKLEYLKESLAILAYTLTIVSQALY